MSQVEKIDYPFVSKKTKEDDSFDDLEGGRNEESVCREIEECKWENSVIGRVEWTARPTEAREVWVSASFTFDNGDALSPLEGPGHVENSQLVRGELKEKGGRERTILVEKCRNPKRWSVRP